MATKRQLLVVGFNRTQIQPFVEHHGVEATAWAITHSRNLESMQGFHMFDFVIMDGVTVPPALLAFLKERGQQVTLHQTLIQRYERWITRRASRFGKQINALHRFLYASRRRPVKSPFEMEE